MSSSDVTREGLQGARPDREARMWEQGGRRRRRGRERSMVPEAEFRSYYDRPVIKKPVWKVDIPAYFFLGGVAAGSSMLAAGGDVTGRPALRRSGRATAFVSVLGSLYFLVHDLGRPGRFVYMLRVARPSSPMSMGSWLLAAYGPLAGLAAVGEAVPALRQRGALRGDVARRAGRLAESAASPAGAAAGALGPVLATYTAVLVSDTAVPAWHEADPELPFVFAASAAAASGGTLLLLTPVAEAGPARRTAVAGGLVELAVAKRMERRMGLVGEPYAQGKAGRWMKAAEALTAAGVAGTLLLGRHRAGAALSGLALAAGSVCTRMGVFEAGMQSAADPRYTVVPQRERLGAGGQ